MVAEDKSLRMVKTVLHEVVKLTGTQAKAHLSLVPIDKSPPPLILTLIELNLQVFKVLNFVHFPHLPGFFFLIYGGDSLFRLYYQTLDASRGQNPNKTTPEKTPVEETPPKVEVEEEESDGKIKIEDGMRVRIF